MKVLIDVVLLLIIALCVWGGYKKGLIMGMGGILAILIAVYGGILVSGAYSNEVVTAFQPFVSGYVESKIQDKAKEDLGLADDDRSLNDLFAEDPSLQQKYMKACYEEFGIYSRTADKLAGETMDYMNDEEVSAEDAVSVVLCQKLTYALFFLLAFILILIILTVLGNIPNLTYKIPNMDTLNNVGGLVAGVVRGILLCSVLVWALKFMGILLGDALSHTLLAKLLLSLNFLTPWIGF